MPDRPDRFILIILDGLGLRDTRENNAFRLARTPTFNRLFKESPWSTLDASQEAVGLPAGVIGNSEVGHMTIGAGRILKNDLVRINDSIADGTFKDKGEIKNILTYVKDKGSALHLLGLVSDGGVHSHFSHIPPLVKCAKAAGVEKVFLHAITDGRDTSPYGGVDYVRQTELALSEIGIGQIATVVGRYYAMDRDRRWDRTERAYRMFVSGEEEKADSAVEAIEKSYSAGVTDEFIEPIAVSDDDGEFHNIAPDDAVLCFNFRADRMRQICPALGSGDFSQFSTLQSPIRLTSMTVYKDNFDFPVVFGSQSIEMKFGEVLAQADFRQLRVAETEKYAHVTYFLNGGDENPYDAEERVLIPSPQVATYDLQPEMSAYGIRQAVVKAIDDESCDAIVMNLANTDMVGHTGDLNATIRAAEVADEVLGNVLEMVTRKRMVAFVTADHGNCEVMVDEETEREHTAHTLNPVPFVLVNGASDMHLRTKGSLSDVAPTILDAVRLPIPNEMTGSSLLES
ncbi:MAG TPA: 2,3-bisphosphoglycerate-independent phosphoglycerate mutase [Candidatus Marinimicrobia bacterium]|nr:2,3-bisphosphoglycerate-independent phosphoglycerate mutase [Candidatus Neomarinimicrobiota bacterium]HIO89974.1 2,3-bisphosphoglycerate-independent phosphoglycerate mutase [Candidatus Neomarinimicrobiota bacterium]